MKTVKDYRTKNFLVRVIVSPSGIKVYGDPITDGYSNITIYVFLKAGIQLATQMSDNIQNRELYEALRYSRMKTMYKLAFRITRERLKEIQEINLKSS